MSQGVLYGIGVGPGESALMTVRAVETLKTVDVIIVPRTEKKQESVAFHIAKHYIPENVEIMPIVFPMVPDMAVQEKAWKENREAIGKVLDEGKNVAFLTLGDPMFYSTYMYVYRALTPEYRVETIPGIPAFLALASQLGRPVAEQEDVVTVLPATADPETLERVISVSDSLVIMKVYKSWPTIKSLLTKYGLIDSAVMISRAGLPDEERFTDLTSIPDDAKLNYLSTILAKRNR